MDCLPRLWQRESHIHTARRRFWIFATSSGHDDVLLSIDHVRCRRCHGCVGQDGFPKQLAGVTIEGAEFLVIHSRADEQDIARGHNRSPIIFRAGVGEPLGREIRIFTQGNLP